MYHRKNRIYFHDFEKQVINKEDGFIIRKFSRELTTQNLVNQGLQIPKKKPLQTKMKIYFSYLWNRIFFVIYTPHRNIMDRKQPKNFHVGFEEIFLNPADLSKAQMSSDLRFPQNDRCETSCMTLSNMTKNGQLEGSKNEEALKKKFDFESQKIVKETQQGFASKIFKKHFRLRKILEDQKKNILANQFKNKITRNIQSAPPMFDPIYKEGNETQDSCYLKIEGIRLPLIVEAIYLIVSLMSILVICYIISLGIVFPHIYFNPHIQKFQIFICFIFLLEIVVCSVTSKAINGQKLHTIGEIIHHYLPKKFPIDLICLLVHFGCQFQTKGNQITCMIRLVIFLKSKEFFEKLSKLENLMTYSFKREKYISLCKIFFLNFAFAHVLSILMIQMTQFESSQNWLEKAQLDHTPHYEQYAWAFYWGVTTMLTIGFGDISPANYKEALCLSVIETISCILLAYTINCVGGVISSLREQQIQKQRNLATMRRIAEEKGLSEDLEKKVCHYIKQTDKMKKKFQLQSDKVFISTLTNELKSEIFKESNQKSFNNLFFFKNLTERTLMMLAEQIETIIAHPEEIVFKCDSPYERVMILLEGKVGYCTHSPKSKYNQSIFNQLTIKKDQSPQLLDLLFLSNKQDTKYDIKSLKHSIISYLNIDKLKEILSLSRFDFQFYCQLKDESKHRTDQYEVLPCDICPKKRHNKINCPKLHYIPFRQIVVLKYIHQFKQAKSVRNQNYQRFSKTQRMFSSVKFRKQCKRFQKLIFGRFLHSEIIKSKSTFCAQQSVDAAQNILKNIWPSIPTLQRINSIGNILEKKLFDFFDKKQGNFNLYSIQDSDQLHDYKHYFVNSNPNLLKSIPLKKKKPKKKKNSDPNAKEEQPKINQNQGVIFNSIMAICKENKKNKVLIHHVDFEDEHDKQSILKQNKTFSRSRRLDLKPKRAKTLRANQSKFQEQ